MHPEPLVRGMLELIDEALAALAEAERDAPDAVRRWADDLTTFGVPWPQWAKDSLYHLNLGALLAEIGILRESFELLRAVIGMFGLPSVLRAEAQKFQGAVLDPLTELHSDMQLSKLLGDDAEVWRSGATDSYKDAYEEQRDHLTTVQTRIEEIIQGLEDAAEQQEAFFTDSLLAVIGLEVSAAGLAVTIATGWTGVGAIIGIVISAIGLVVSLIGVIKTFFEADSQAQAVNETRRGEPLPQWPESAFAN